MLIFQNGFTATHHFITTHICFCDISENRWCFVPPPSCCLCQFFGELKLIATAGANSILIEKRPHTHKHTKNSILWVSHNREVHLQLWFSTWTPPPLSRSHLHFSSPLSSTPPLLLSAFSSCSFKGGNRAGQRIRCGPHRDTYRERPWVLRSSPPQ